MIRPSTSTRRQSISVLRPCARTERLRRGSDRGGSRRRRRRRSARPARRSLALLRHFPALAILVRSRARTASDRTPNVIAMSATLNAGHSGSLMKSVTDPLESRSIRLPSAPPTSRPVGSHSRRRCGRSAKYTEQRRERDQRQHQHQRAAAGEEAERDAAGCGRRRAGPRAGTCARRRPRSPI